MKKGMWLHLHMLSVWHVFVLLGVETHECGGEFMTGDRVKCEPDIDALRTRVSREEELSELVTMVRKTTSCHTQPVALPSSYSSPLLFPFSPSLSLSHVFSFSYSQLYHYDLLSLHIVRLLPLFPLSLLPHILLLPFSFIVFL